MNPCHKYIHGRGGVHPPYGYQVKDLKEFQGNLWIFIS